MKAQTPGLDRTHWNLVYWIVLLALGLLLMLPAAPARADIGPKPNMTFSLVYQIEPVDILIGDLIECEDEACETGQSLEKMGPQDFTCTANTCSSMAYGYAPYHKLVITFKDRTRESNVFTKEAFEARYKVRVTDTALIVEEVRPAPRICGSSVLLTLVLEMIIAGLYLSIFRLPKKTLRWVPFASLFSLPVVWLVFPQLALSAGWIVGLSETFAVLFEAGFIYMLTYRAVPLKHVAVLSLAMNAASFLVGLLI